jgi:hypothetical protein
MIITPPLGTDLTGFGFYLDRKAERVLDDLKVRALYLDDQKARLLIISCDLLGLSVARADRIRSQSAPRSVCRPGTSSWPARTLTPGRRQRPCPVWAE